MFTIRKAPERSAQGLFLELIGSRVKYDLIGKLVENVICMFPSVYFLIVCNSGIRVVIICIYILFMTNLLKFSLNAKKT